MRKGFKAENFKLAESSDGGIELMYYTPKTGTVYILQITPTGEILLAGSVNNLTKKFKCDERGCVKICPEKF